MATNKGTKRKYDSRKKGKRQDSEDEDEVETTSRSKRSRNVPSKDNDPSWYAANEFMLKDAASIPFSNRAGLPIQMPNHGLQNPAYGNFKGLNGAKFTFPSVMGIACSLTPGVSEFAESPVNVAARNIYSWVRHANSGHANYDAPNLMLYLVAMDSLYAIYSHCARMYGLIRTYSARNAGLPRALFAACGWDYEDFMYNQVQFRLWLNTFAQKVGSMCVPASMTYMTRHLWMFQNVFADGQTSKASFYMYFPYDVYEYAATGARADDLQTEFADSKGTPGLVSHPVGFTADFMGQLGGKMKFKRLTEILDLVVESIMASEDLGIMSGDILKAFGAENVWRLVPIHEDFEVLPVYSTEVMEQIHNLNLVGEPKWFIGQDGRDDAYNDGYNVSALKELVIPSAKKSLLVTPKQFWARGFSKTISNAAWIADAATEGDQFINMHMEDVTPGDVMVATRLMSQTYYTEVTWKAPGTGTAVDTNTAKAAVPLATGSDVARFLTFVKNEWNDTGLYDPNVMYIDSLAFNANLSQAGIVDRLRMLGYLETFQYHPMFYGYDTRTADVSLISEHGDIENWTTITEDVLKRMHEVALLSQFNVPLMGAWNQKVR